MKDRTLGIAAEAPPGVMRGDLTDAVAGEIAGESIDRRADVQSSFHARQHPRTLLRSAFDDIATTLFPADCRVCGGPLLEASLLPVCRACLDTLRPQSCKLCGCCGEALEADEADVDIESARSASQFGPEAFPEDGFCPSCRLVPHPFERAIAYGVYDETLRELIHLLKYESVASAAGILGRHLAQAALSLPRRPMVVVAVPLFPAKQRQRGYNQAMLLADAMTADLRRTTPDWRLKTRHSALHRTRQTESQFALTPRKRLDNLRGAFEVKEPAVIAGREVMLIDDIYTTGATASECARVLRASGASRVWVATLSRAQPEFVALGGARDPTGSSDLTAAWDAPPVEQLS